MDTPDDFDVNASWRWLLIEIELARSVHVLGGAIPGRPVPSQPVLDLLIPALLYIRAVALLDEALGKHIDDHGYSSGSSLHARLVCLDARGELAYTNAIRDLKDRRNLVAHRSNAPAQPHAVTWDELDTAVSLIESALQQLVLVGPRPDFHFFFERSSDIYIERLGQLHPTNPDVAMTQHFVYGVREGDVRILELSVSFEYGRLVTASSEQR